VNNKTDTITYIRSWLSVLDDLRQENILLKSRLSNALQGEVSRSFIETAEDYQQRFIYKDQLIDLLRHELTDLLSEKTGDRQEQLSIWQDRITLLEKDIQRLSLEFSLMKTGFDNYLSEKSTPDLPSIY
jgi:hypothetical protein